MCRSGHSRPQPTGGSAGAMIGGFSWFHSRISFVDARYPRRYLAGRGTLGRANSRRSGASQQHYQAVSNWREAARISAARGGPGACIRVTRLVTRVPDLKRSYQTLAGKAAGQDCCERDVNGLRGTWRYTPFGLENRRPNGSPPLSPRQATRVFGVPLGVP